jgi:hypothetical protein
VFILPQVALHRLIQLGVKSIKQNPEILDEIFCYYNLNWAEADYGQSYIDQIKTWFVDTKIPVVQAWSVNVQKAPQIAIRLSSEQEDISKTGLSDHYLSDSIGTVGMSPFSTTLEILLMTTKNSDEALWLYYIVLYILFKNKALAHSFGMELQTVSASDNARDVTKLTDNIWVRSIRFTTVVQHSWRDMRFLEIDDIDLDVEVESNKEIDGSIKV